MKEYDVVNHAECIADEYVTQSFTDATDLIEEMQCDPSIYTSSEMESAVADANNLARFMGWQDMYQIVYTDFGPRIEDL